MAKYRPCVKCSGWNSSLGKFLLDEGWIVNMFTQKRMIYSHEVLLWCVSSWHSTYVNQNLNEVTNTASPTHGVKIGSYLVERGVRAQLGQLKNRYPNLYTMLNYKMNTQSSASKTLYSLVAGPLQTEQEANKLCQVFELIYSHCETTECKGVNL